MSGDPSSGSPDNTQQPNTQSNRFSATPERCVRAIWLEPSGRSSPFLFDEAQVVDAVRDAIGGDLEFVYMPPLGEHEYGLACFMDDDRIEKQLPENPRAGGLFPGLNPILGPVIISGWNRDKDELDDCPKHILEHLRES